MNTHAEDVLLDDLRLLLLHRLLGRSSCGSRRSSGILCEAAAGGGGACSCGSTTSSCGSTSSSCGSTTSSCIIIKCSQMTASEDDRIVYRVTALQWPAKRTLQTPA